MVLLASIVYLIIDYFIAKKFQEIAEEKGHNGTSYFWLCFWLTWIGWIMVAALPNNTRNNSSTNHYTYPSKNSDDELPDL